MAADDLLREVGEALFGSRWQTDIAKALRVDDRTIRRWASGNEGLPVGVIAELADLCRDRTRRLFTMAETIMEAECWYAFRAYGCQAVYGFGTAAEAAAYTDLLSDGRDKNHYAPYAIGAAEAEERQLRDNSEAVCLATALQDAALGSAWREGSMAGG